jgi:hypothetical protein
MDMLSPACRSSEGRLALSSGVGCTPVFNQMKHPVYHLTVCFVNIFPEFKIAMFPEAPQNSSKALRVLIVIVLKEGEFAVSN